MSFEDRLQKAVERGKRRSETKRHEAAARAMTEEELKRSTDGRPGIVEEADDQPKDHPIDHQQQGGHDVGDGRAAEDRWHTG